MIYMLESIIMYVSITISVLCLFFRLTQLSTSKIIIIKASINLIIICTITLAIKIINPDLYKIIYILLFLLSLFQLKQNPPAYTIGLGIISIGLAYCIRGCSIILVGILADLLNYRVFGSILCLSIALFHIIITLLLIKVKRFCKGFSFFQNKNNLGIGLFFSGFIIIFSCINIQKRNLSNITLTILIIGLLISFFGLYLWIRKSITEHYRKKLQTRADEHYQNTLSEKEQQIEQLNNSNAFLSKIVHRDNHIMSSLQHTITKYKDCDNPEEREKLLNEILILAQERSDLIVKEQVNTKVLPTTGISLIDGALSNMYIKTSAHNIDFNLIINQDIHYLVNNLITQTDLETLLCDHIKDAIIAINSNAEIKGKILVTITMNDDIYEISIKDNGVEFEVDTLAKLGLERVTTHKNTGGNGIGFMTTFETLKKSNASLIITEHKTKTPFSKSITFRFDGLNAFIINSYRADLLKQSINRNDIVIM